jgi:hypothetical protein
MLSVWSTRTHIARRGECITIIRSGFGSQPEAVGPDGGLGRRMVPPLKVVQRTGFHSHRRRSEAHVCVAMPASAPRRRSGLARQSREASGRRAVCLAGLRVSEFGLEVRCAHGRGVVFGSAGPCGQELSPSRLLPTALCATRLEAWVTGLVCGALPYLDGASSCRPGSVSCRAG